MDNKDQCSICLDDLTDDGELIKLPGCKHVFHTKCFFEVMSANGTRVVACPLCRDSAVELPVLGPPVVVEGPPRIIVVNEEDAMSGSRRRLDNYLKNVLLVLTCGTLWYLVFGLLDQGLH